jgi:choline dehydrogenase-like flavoprotein
LEFAQTTEWMSLSFPLRIDRASGPVRLVTAMRLSRPDINPRRTSSTKAATFRVNWTRHQRELPQHVGSNAIWQRAFLKLPPRESTARRLPRAREDADSLKSAQERFTALEN